MKGLRVSLDTGYICGNTYAVEPFYFVLPWPDSKRKSKVSVGLPPPAHPGFANEKLIVAKEPLAS